jgi:hypothetical protein
MALWKRNNHSENIRKDTSLNVSIISKLNVKDSALDVLANALPVIVAGVMDVPGGSLARVKPEQVSLVFSQASLRDVGPDIRIMIYAKRNDPRILTENERAKTILEKVIELITKSSEEYSIDIRLYLMEIGVAEHILPI